MTRPDHPSGTDRVAEAARAADDDIVINIQGDEPLIDPALIDQLVERMLADEQLDMVTAVTAIRSMEELESNNVVKVVCDKAKCALYFSRHAIPFCRDREINLETDPYWRHIGIYGYRGAFLKKMVEEPPCKLEASESLEQLRALYLGGKIAVEITDEIAIGVDCPEDVQYVQKEIEERGLCPK